MPPILVQPSTVLDASKELEVSDGGLGLSESVDTTHNLKEVDDVQRDVEDSRRLSREKQSESDTYELIPGSLKRRVRTTEEEGLTREPRLLEDDADRHPTLHIDMAAANETPYQRNTQHFRDISYGMPASRKAVAPSSATIARWNLAQKRLNTEAKHRNASIRPGHLATSSQQSPSFYPSEPMPFGSIEDRYEGFRTTTPHSRDSLARPQDQTASNSLRQQPSTDVSNGPKGLDQFHPETLYENENMITGRSSESNKHQETYKPVIVEDTRLLQVYPQPVSISREADSPPFLSNEIEISSNIIPSGQQPVQLHSIATTSVAVAPSYSRDRDEWAQTMMSQLVRPNNQGGLNNGSLQPSASISIVDTNQLPGTLPVEITDPVPRPLPTEVSSNSNRQHRAASKKRPYPSLKPC